MECPKCTGTELEQRRVPRSDLFIDICPSCAGAWFDAGELEESLSVAVRNLKPPHDARHTGIYCPKCRVSLRSFRYPGTFVTIDMCRQCGGLWLDAKEYDEIKVVREHRKLAGTLEQSDPVGGIKGTLLRFIDTAIDSFSPF